LLKQRLIVLSRVPKPVLWGAVPLTLLGVYWLSQQIWPLIELGVISAGLGWLAWQWGKQRPVAAQTLAPKEVTTAHVQQTLTETAAIFGQLGQTPQTSPQLPLLQTQATSIATGLNRETLEIAILGGNGVGKTTLRQLLQTTVWPCACDWQEAPLPEPHAIPTADLVLLVLQADITQPEYACLQALKQQGQRTVVVWNKQDQFLAADHQQVQAQLQQQLRELVASADLLAVSAAPLPLQVRQHQADGTIREWQEQPPPQIQALQTRLQEIFSQEARQLVVQHTWQQAQSLKTDAQTLLNRARRQQALPIIERYQWIAGGAAALSPLPALDLLGVGVVTVKMVQEIGALYQQSVSLEQAKTIGTTLASLILKLGLVELSTQALTTVLKTSSLTYLLGAGLQGISTAYLTRIAGLTLVEHFQTVSALDAKSNSQTLSQQLHHHLSRTMADQAKPEVFKALAQASIAQLPSGQLPLPQLTQPQLEPILQERFSPLDSARL
jgi:uncharacterized protein